MTVNEYFREAMKDQEARRLYREVLEEEFRRLLRDLQGGEGETPGLGVSLEAIARWAQGLGLGLRLEFVDGEGEVRARWSLSPDEPLEG